MLKKITESSLITGLGDPPQKKLLKVSSGAYAGRLVALIATASADIKLSWADQPYTSWSTPSSVATDSSADTFEGLIDSSGNIHVVYTEQSTKNLVTVKLTFADGDWTVGSKVTVYTGDQNTRPSLSIEGEGKLWVSWTRDASGLEYVHVKSSADSGATWGSGPTDSGDQLNSGNTTVYSKVMVADDRIYCVYVRGATQLYCRSYPVGGGSWSSEETVASGLTTVPYFDAALTGDGKPAVVYNDTVFRYREYDGTLWGTVVTLDSTKGIRPQLTFENGEPAVVYLVSGGLGQYLIKYTTRQTGSFQSPATLDSRAATFESTTLYDSISSTYADLSGAASSTASADVYHPTSGVLVKEVGDKLYAGMDQRFRYMIILLSTSGAGGAVSYSYWDGSNWSAFTPESGAFDLDAAETDLLLWTDYAGMPGDWQITSVNGQSRFWVKIEVTSPFTTGPIGTQITAQSDLRSLNVRR